MLCNVYVRGYSIMSNNYNDNNGKQTQKSTTEQQSDEAFINQLYDEVSQGQQNQPSELLDQRILSAAHKAINKSNTPGKKSHVTWYSSLATAASLTLVVSLVVLQQANILPNEQAESTQVKDVEIQKAINLVNNTESFAEQEIVPEIMHFQERASFSSVTNSIADKTKETPNKGVMRTMQYEKQNQLATKTLAKPIMASSPKTIQLLEKSEQRVKTEIMALSTEQLQQYLQSNKALKTQNQWRWSLHSENDVEYIIDIFNKDQQPLQYRLDKRIFKILDIPEQNLTKRPLNSRPLSNITILAENN